MTGSFTLILLRAFLRHKDAEKTIRGWIADEPNPLKRAVRFGEALRLSFEKTLGFDENDEQLLKELMAAVSERTAWDRIAEELVNRYMPRLLATYTRTPSIN
jgi:hypothetical protein